MYIVHVHVELIKPSCVALFPTQGPFLPITPIAYASVQPAFRDTIRDVLDIYEINSTINTGDPANADIVTILNEIATDICDWVCTCTL